jgi:hypothetical protein
MSIVAILVALAVLYWLGSLAYAYFTYSTEFSQNIRVPGSRPFGPASRSISNRAALGHIIPATTTFFLVQ